MSANSSDLPPLPANVNDWPTDPRTLLGVSSDISRRDLKRAYARLIKKYKPEHAPEEFRRLRAAYEKLDQQLEWHEDHDLRRRVIADESNPSTVNPDTTPAEPSREIFRPFEGNRRPARTDDDHQGSTALPNVASEFRAEQADAAEDAGQHGGSRPLNPDELWQRALDGGDLQPIYSELVTWQQRRRASEIDFARLYWLTTLASDLEPDRDPCIWLIEGLRQHRASARLFEMLETEVRRRDGQVPAVLEDGLLDPDDVTWRLVNFVELRWYAARRQGRFDVISDDFQSLKRAFLDEPHQWLRLLHVGLRHVIISHSSGLIEQFRQELQHAPAHAANDQIWDSIEADLALNKAWTAPVDALQILPFGIPERLQQIQNLIEATWLASVTNAREPVLHFSQQLAEYSQRSLSELTIIESEARPLLIRLQELFRPQMLLTGTDYHTELTPPLQRELQRFIRHSFPDGNLDNFPVTVMEYCLFQAVTPRDISTVLSQMSVDVPDEYFGIAERLTKNLALTCVIDANRLLW